MKGKICLTLFCIFFLLLFCSTDVFPAGVITFYGKLKVGGTSYTGTKTMELKVFDASSGGTQLYTSGSTSVGVSSGFFWIEIPSDIADWFNVTGYVELVIDGTTLSPRIKITGVAYSQIAYQLPGDYYASTYVNEGQASSITSAMIVDGAIVNGDLASGAFSNITDVGTLSSLTVSGNVGIGTTGPDTELELSKDSSSTTLTISSYHDTEATTPTITLRKADGSESSPSAVDDNAVLGTINFNGYDNDGFDTGAVIYAQTDANWGASERGTELYFQTRDGSGSLTDRMIIDAEGNIGMAGNTNPSYALHMEASGGGYYDVSDHQWHTGSTKDIKRDIKPNNMDVLKILDQVEILNYRYKTEYAKDRNAPFHIGFIAENTPRLLSGRDQNSMATGDCLGFLFAVAKAQQDQLDVLSGKEVEKVVKEAEVTKEGDMVFRNDSEDRDLVFEINQDGQPVEVMRVDGEKGSVGIGIQSPSTTLEVDGTIKSCGSDSDWTNDRFGKGFELGQGNAMVWGKGEGQFARGICVDDDKIYFLRSDTDDNLSEPQYDMVIDENGNVGIGTVETENFKLTVSGDTYCDGTILTSKGYIGYSIGRFINGSGTTLERGSLVKIKSSGITEYTGKDNLMPVPEVTLTEGNNEYGVVGIVLGESNIPGSSSDTETGIEYVDVVITGTFAVCKVTGEINCGAWLVSSANGCAKEADSEENNLVAMALENYTPGESRKDYIAVLIK